MTKAKERLGEKKGDKGKWSMMKWVIWRLRELNGD